MLHAKCTTRAPTAVVIDGQIPIDASRMFLRGVRACGRYKWYHNAVYAVAIVEQTTVKMSVAGLPKDENII